MKCAAVADPSSSLFSRALIGFLVTLVPCAAALAQTPPPPATHVRVLASNEPAPTPTVTVSPTSVLMAPGGTQLFTALVTGTANQQVIWTATGGTITSDGTFTAQMTSGTFAVTATLARGTIKGTAQIEIIGPPMIEIQPGQNIQSIVNANPTGASFLLKAGVHRLQTIIPKTGQTFAGETGAILSGARVLSAFSRAGNAWVASGQTQEGTTSGSATDGVCRSTFARCGRPEDLFMDDVALQHVTSLSAGGPGKWYFDYAADQIFIWDDPGGRTVETSITPAAFSGYASNVTIRNLIVEKYAAPTFTSAIELRTGWIIEDSEVRWNHFGGIGNGPGSIARRNKVHHNGCYGFHGSGANVLVEANEIAFNGYAGYNPFWGSGGSKWVYTDHLVVRGNFSHHNLGPGLWTDIDNIYTLYENNIAEDNERGGIFHEISYDATIRNNTLRRNGTGRDFPYWTTGAGIEIVGSSNVEVYGNTLEDNWQGITGLDDHRGTGTRGPWTLLNLFVHDNVVTSRVVDAGAGRTGIVDTAGTGAFSSSANNRYRQNFYTLGSNPEYFIWMASDRTESQWQGTGNDTTGTFRR